MVALSDPSKLLQSGSSSFPLLQDLNFGSSYGLKLNYIKSQSLNPASAGFLRLGYDQNVSWRNNTNSGDLSLNLDGSDNLQFNSTKIPLSGTIVNADINASAAIDISKINNLQSSLNSLNPMTTAGDLIRGAASGTPERLAIGALGSLLRSNGTTAAWDSSIHVAADGKVGIGTSSPLSTIKGLDISSGGISLVLGAEDGVGTRTDSVTKISRIASAHYLSAEEPTTILTSVSDATTNRVRIGGGSSSLNSATEITFHTAANTTTLGGTERMRIDSSGNVGIGTTTPQAREDIVFSNAGSNYPVMRLGAASATTPGAATDGGFINYQNNNRLDISRGWHWSNGVNYYSHATTGSCLTLDESGNFIFQNGTGLTAGGNNNLTTRMQLDTAGDLAIKKFELGGLSGLSIDNTGKLLRTPSDISLKENIETHNIGLEAVKALNPVVFNWKDIERFGDKQDIGFIAQEVEVIIPQLVSKNPDETKSIDYAKFASVLAKAIQELSAKNDEKDAQISSLQSDVSSLQSENQALQSSLNALIARIEALENA